MAARARAQLYRYISTVERGFAANAYGNRKDKDYATIIKSKNLDLHYKSVTFGTFGSFGSGTWSVISVACDPLTHPRASDDYNPWNSPGPKRDFTLSLLASPYSEPIPACCVMLTSVVASRVVAENIPLAPVLRPLMRTIRRVYVGLTSYLCNSKYCNNN